jgi:hypothetical protein
MKYYFINIYFLINKKRSTEPEPTLNFNNIECDTIIGKPITEMKNVVIGDIDNRSVSDSKRINDL